YRISELSRYAVELLAELRIEKGVGDCLTEADVQSILIFYMSLLTAAVDGGDRHTDSAVARLHVVSPLQIPDSVGEFAVTVSGGVGGLIYSHLQGEPWPSTTCYGDLGIDLAEAILKSPWADHFQSLAPQSAGRATVYGLLRHNTEVSGNTLFLPNPGALPLTDLPILGVITSGSTDEDIEALVCLAKSATHGVCVRVQLSDDDGAAVRSLAQRISKILKDCEFPPAQPLLLLVSENVGKVLGHYMTQWGALPLNLVVIDEIDHRHAQYVRVGRLHEQVVPVSFYGLQDQEDSHENSHAAH
nr:ethanolamine ammonia-lyase reactivating factor EutA [Planctomycetota bacterium]